VITELESHTSQQALTPQHESKVGEEPQRILEGSMARASSRRVQRRLEERENLLDA
jgi:hypothetical protein